MRKYEEAAKEQILDFYLGIIDFVFCLTLQLACAMSMRWTASSMKDCPLPSASTALITLLETSAGSVG